MQTPSLERRVNRAGVAVVAAIVLTLDVVVWLSLAASLDAGIDDALDLRVAVVHDVGERTTTVSGLARELTKLGIPAEVSGGGLAATAQPAVQRSLPGEELILSVDAADLVSEVVDVRRDRRVEVFVSQAGARATIRRLLLIEGVASVAALLAASLLLRRGTAHALTPLDHVVTAAQLTAEGHAGLRLEPNDPTSELGRLAVAYDRMLDELETALAVAKDAEEASRRFLADAAHQLRTPLASMRAGVELLLVEPDPRRRDDHLGTLLRETARGTKVLNSLLTLARLDRGRPLDREDLDVLALCRDEIERTQSLAPHLDCVLEDQRSQGRRVVADGDAIHEALANLLDNARRHATGRVVVRVRHDLDHLAVEVRDDGAGVAPDDRRLIFERFATLDGRGGSGLGLPIARAVARGHGGDLVHDDDAFVLTLPLEAATPVEEATTPVS